MKNGIILIALTVIFTIGLVFASIELPRLLSEIIQTPDYDQTASGINMGKSELFIQHYHLRTWGYVFLSFILLLIVISFFTNKDKLAIIGAFALFLPIFGHFALSMFFLAGLGLLRFIWLPITDFFPFAMRLGEIVYVPYNLLLELGYLFNQNWHTKISITFIVLGIIVFILGVFAWFSIKFNKRNVVDIWIYRISRHPQYLGWILWSYGMFIFPIENQKRGWEYPDSFPWLLATLVIVAVSMFEELKVQKQFGDEYIKFKSKTSFMLPFPKWLKKALLHPAVLIFKKNKITHKREIAVITSYYLVLFMIISYILLVFQDPSIPFKPLNKYRKLKVEQLVSELKKSKSRRTKDIAAMNLEQFGSLAKESLIELLSDTNVYVRNYTIRTLGNGNIKESSELILKALKDSSINVQYEAAVALGKLNYYRACDELFELLVNNKGTARNQIVLTLGKLEYEKIIPFIIDDIEGRDKYTTISYIEALSNFNTNEVVNIINGYLLNDDKLIVEAAIVAVAKLKPPSVLPELEQLALDQDREISLYSKQAIKIICKQP